MKKTTVYQTTDGTNFEDKKDATNHELYLSLINAALDRGIPEGVAVDYVNHLWQIYKISEKKVSKPRKAAEDDGL